MHAIFSPYIILVAALWYGINGILHDIFVIRAHKTGYDRDLMRLLIDGHLLILSGIMMLISWLMIRENNIWGAIVGLITGISMIVYCALIFPFLKSFGTLLISIIACIVCVALIYFGI